MPSVAYLPLTALMASAGLVNGCKFFGALNSSSGQGLWRNWQDFLGLLGIAMLPQVVCYSASIPYTYLALACIVIFLCPATLSSPAYSSSGCFHAA